MEVDAEPVWAYCGPRSLVRTTTKGERRHAVTWMARLCGALDAECGTIGAVEIGLWDPADPLNCPKCAKYLAGAVPVPEEEAAKVAPHRSGTPSILTAA